MLDNIKFTFGAWDRYLTNEKIIPEELLKCNNKSIIHLVRIGMYHQNKKFMTKEDAYSIVEDYMESSGKSLDVIHAELVEVASNDGFFTSEKSEKQKEEIANRNETVKTMMSMDGIEKTLKMLGIKKEDLIHYFMDQQ